MKETLTEQQERAEWEAMMRYWCNEAETSAGAAQIEAFAARQGFRGERAKLFPEIDKKLKYIKFSSIKNYQN